MYTGVIILFGVNLTILLHTLRDRSRRCVIAVSLGLRKVGPSRSAARIPSADPEYAADYGPRAHPHVYRRTLLV